MVHFSEKGGLEEGAGGGGGRGDQNWTCSDDVRSCKQFQVKVHLMKIKEEQGAGGGRKRRALIQPCVPIMDSSK